MAKTPTEGVRPPSKAKEAVLIHLMATLTSKEEGAMVPLVSQEPTPHPDNKEAMLPKEGVEWEATRASKGAIHLMGSQVDFNSHLKVINSYFMKLNTRNSR